MQLQVTGEVWYWRGPAPFHFVTLPEPLSAQIRAVASALTYGWGMIPVVATIGETTFDTSMFRKDELYVVPVKNVVRNGEGIEVGDTVTIDLVMTPR